MVPILPITGLDANICPASYYCPQGSADPEPCPVGTYSNSTGLHADVDCILCPAGSYCDQIHMLEPAGLCNAG